MFKLGNLCKIPRNIILIRKYQRNSIERNIDEIITELEGRKLIESRTESPKLIRKISELRENKETGVYVGIDPTSSSLHIGNLVSIILLNHFRLAGFRAIIMIGGATALIGDPAGKLTQRRILGEDIVAYNTHRLLQQIHCLSSNIQNHYSFMNYKHNVHTQDIPIAPIKYMNNLQFYENLNILNFFRDIGY